MACTMTALRPQFSLNLGRLQVDAAVLETPKLNAPSASSATSAASSTGSFRQQDSGDIASRESSFGSCQEFLDDCGPQASSQPRIQPWNTDWFATEEGRTPIRRSTLPVAAEPPKRLNVWSLIKDWVGKDITRLSVPVYINEPLCELQRRAEGFEHSYLLDEAAEMPAQSQDRLLAIAAYAVSICCTIRRTTKPFKDLQNATYELVYPERGYRLVGEKVAHTPATHCMMCEGRRWRFMAWDEAHMDFVLQHIRIKPTGLLTVTFDDGDTYEWNPAHIYIHNLVIGNLYLDHRGHITVVQRATGDVAKLSLSENLLNNLSHRYTHQVKGHLEHSGKKVPKLKIHGRWDEALYVKNPAGVQRTLWTISPALTPAEPRFGLSRHAIHLQELLPGMATRLPCTDVRLRPDMRLFEDGYPDKANAEKDRLEEKQRQERHAREAAGQVRPACWFVQEPVANGDSPAWRYKGGYWESRQAGRFEECPDIYGPSGQRRPSSASGMKCREITV